MRAKRRVLGVAKALLAVFVLASTPASVFAEALADPCAARHHKCDAPAFVSCCCRDSVDEALPATTDSGREASRPDPNPGPVLAILHESALAPAAFAWVTGPSPPARPPQPLHLLHLVIRR